jgi:hypothetical protein
MAILMTAEVPGQTLPGYDQMIDALAPIYRSTAGFLLHASHPVEGGWRVIDVWQSKAEFERFYAQHVAPNLPPRVRPKITVQELHDVVAAAPDGARSEG